jgi:hypothetical protein
MIFRKKINKSNIIYIVIILIILLSSVRYFKRQERFHNEEPIIARIKFDCSKLDDIIKTIDFYPADESYTEDKKRIYLCLRDENDNYYDYNMLMYVAIHECAHALTDVIDPEHKTIEFKTTFQNLLQKAEKLGLYDPSKEIIENYCKIKKKKKSN